jgi:hypothetical protein
MQTYQVKIDPERMADTELFLAIMKALHFVVSVDKVEANYESGSAKPSVRQFKGLLGKKSMEQIDANIANMRGEWERNI